MSKVCFFIILLLTIAVSAVAEYPLNAKTNEPAVNVRQSPRSNSVIIEKLRNGSNLTVIGEEVSNGVLWYAVKLNDGRSGYVKGNLLTLEKLTSVPNGIPQYGNTTPNGYPVSGNQPGNYQTGGYPANGNQMNNYQAGGYPANGNQPGNYQTGGYPANGNQMNNYQAGGYPVNGNQPGNYQTGGYPANGNQMNNYQAGGYQSNASQANSMVQVPLSNQSFGGWNITFTTKHNGGSNFNNVGNSWTFYYELNGEKVDKAGGRAEFVPGKEYTFYARIKEQDGKPDAGTATTKYTPTTDEIMNGFVVQQKVRVEENGGKYRGRAVTWTVNWNIQPIR